MENNTQDIAQNNLKKLLEDSKNIKDPRKINAIVTIPTITPETAAPRVLKKRQCANCTCSRSKENIIKEAVVVEKPLKSGCGSCSLGDAFRCEGCIYKGMPAFEEGQKFEFTENLNDL